MSVLCAVLLAVGAVGSGGEITEPEAIRLFVEESPQARRVHAVFESADAAARIEAPVTNPSVAYQVEDSAGVRDEFLTFAMELPITGRRGLVRDGADAAASAAVLSAERDLVAEVSDLRHALYGVLYHKAVEKRSRRGVELLERVVGVLDAREREGEGSGYDLLRAEEELAAGRIAHAEAEGQLAVARARFGSFFDPALQMEDARLTGEIEPSGEIPDADEAVARALSSRADLASLRAEAERLDLARRASRRRRFPEPTLTAGWKRTETLGLDDTGFVASLTVPVPIFERGQVVARRAEADGARVALDVAILEREVRAEVHAALARERAAREAMREYGAGVETRAKELRSIADLSYADGETGILELLDAYRVSLASEMRALAVRYEARRAEIDRQRAVGFEVKP